MAIFDHAVATPMAVPCLCPVAGWKMKMLMQWPSCIRGLQPDCNTGEVEKGNPD